MRQLFAAVAGVIGLIAMGSATSARAQLQVGDPAPVFSTSAALAGERMNVILTAMLREGPVVLYFYPKAFTSGCTLEANAFAEAMPEFKAEGASVLGMSNDDIETLKRFSREECRDAFPVGVATRRLIEAYDVGSGNSGFARRTSYVIGQDGRIAHVYSSGDWRGHVRETLAGVRALSD